MKLVALSISKYRSIVAAPRVEFSQYTVLLGPNNEGKSNVIRALVTAMEVLSRHGRFRGTVTLRPPSVKNQSGPAQYAARLLAPDYDWARDFPVHLQDRQPNGKSTFTLEFDLSPDEIAEFRAEIGSSLNGVLPVKLSISNSTCEIKVVKRGRGGSALTKKSSAVARFISSRIDLQYIPAVRTARRAIDVVGEMVSTELATIEEDPEYLAALAKLEEMQRPVLDALAVRVRDTLGGFVPRIADVYIGIPPEDRRRALRRACIIEIDDGTRTRLEQKGDGIQSLAAIALMRPQGGARRTVKSQILALEEPESHLHPGAIHGLRSVLGELAAEHQLVITTHCPLFVDRARPGATIVVKENKARKAQDIEEIRSVLGVRAADNLRSAEWALCVEGLEDAASLRRILVDMSQLVERSLASNALAIDVLNGAAKLEYKLSVLRDVMCLYLVLLDDDRSGHDAANAAMAVGLLDRDQVVYTICPGLKEAEFEDLLDWKQYKGTISATFGVDIDCREFRNGKNKWSERMAAAFRAQGRQWDDRVKAEAKRLISGVVSTQGAQAVHPDKQGSLLSLVKALEVRLS